MQSLRTIAIVAQYTFTEMIKSKILLNVFFLGLGLMFVTYIGSEFTYGVPEKVALDFGLGSLSLSSVGIAIFMGVGLISKEIENRTVYMILCRPIARHSFLIGRCLGLGLILLINILLLGSMTIGLSLLLGGSYEPLISWAVFFGILEALIIMMVVVSFSLVTNNVMSVVYTLVIFTLGHAVGETKNISFAKKSPVLMNLLEGYGYVFPNLSKINIKEFITYEQNLSPGFLFGASAYGLIYLAFLIFLASFIFKQKSLD